MTDQPAASASATPATYDLLIRGGSVVSVFTGEVFPADVVLRGEDIAGVLPPGSVDAGLAADVLDAAGQTIAPGFIDAHIHVESTFVTPAAFAWLTLPRGTTTVLADPHEIVNVAGAPGLRWMIEAGHGTGQTILYGVPSCVPALLGFETAGAELSAEDISEMLDWPGVIGLGEVMDYRAVVRGDERMRGIVKAARDKGKLIDGHCTNLSGVDLSRYLAEGIDSDHTKNPVEIHIEKARMGMLVMIQEKSVRPELFEQLAALPIQPPLCLVTDDVAPDAIVERGHLDHVARCAVQAGMPVLEALRAMTWTPAQRLRLYDRGIVSPGKRADLVLLPDLAQFAPSAVISGGRVVARDGMAVLPEPQDAALPFRDTVKVGGVTPDDFRWRLDVPAGHIDLTAIRANPVDTATRPDRITLPVEEGEVQWEGQATLLSIVERHGRGATRACAPLLGFTLGDGAVATTYSHDSHNLTAIGTSTEAMALAANTVIQAGGGIAVVHNGRVTALLRLPVGGLMSDRPIAEVVTAAKEVRAALHAWGYRHANAFMSVSTLSLPVSPALKLTDQGLVDVDRRAWADAVASHV
ncbi:MAG: adenine deaminase [Chloroflexi bacterium]|nr:adenine deaminase [Chloroflexota bacterium]